MKTTENIKTLIQDKNVSEDTELDNFARHEFTRVYAVERTFTRVSFEQSNFNACYFRKCRFIECDFTGAVFRDTNLTGSQFSNCKFRYSYWDKTIVDEKILCCLPAEENLARDLVRNLRVNFAQIGHQEAVNKAAKIEVELTGKHLRNAVSSNQGYYRQKYKGWDRAQKLVELANWVIWESVWGNGESIYKVVACAVTIPLISGGLFSWVFYPDRKLPDNIASAFFIFWGVRPQYDVSPELALLLTIIRFILFGLFMAILVKRLSRR